MATDGHDWPALSRFPDDSAFCLPLDVVEATRVEDGAVTGDDVFEEDGGSLCSAKSDERDCFL